LQEQVDQFYCRSK